MSWCSVCLCFNQLFCSILQLQSIFPLCRHEALVAATCEKDANMALLQMTAPPGGASGPAAAAVNKLMEERSRLQEQMRDVASRREEARRAVQTASSQPSGPAGARRGSEAATGQGASPRGQPARPPPPPQQKRWSPCAAYLLYLWCFLTLLNMMDVSFNFLILL